MDCLLNSSNPQHLPCFENDGVLETASLFALLRDSGIGIAGRGQSDLNGESAVILLYGGEGIGVDGARIVRFDVGGPVALNAADEVAVAAFLDGNIGFDQIPRVIQDVLDETQPRRLESIKEILITDAEARRLAQGCVQALSRSSSPSPRTVSARWQ